MREAGTRGGGRDSRSPLEDGKTELLIQPSKKFLPLKQTYPGTVRFSPPPPLLFPPQPWNLFLKRTLSEHPFCKQIERVLLALASGGESGGRGAGKLSLALLPMGPGRHSPER